MKRPRALPREGPVPDRELRGALSPELDDAGDAHPPDPLDLLAVQRVPPERLLRALRMARARRLALTLEAGSAARSR
jgi:hypothetical protein